MKNDFFDKLGYTIKNGLVHNLEEAQNNVERLYIEEVKKLNIFADAVFFRRFYKDDSDEMPHFSVPTVCIFNQSDSFFNTENHKTLHAALWSAGKTEIYLIVGTTRVDVINARKPAVRISDVEVTIDHKDLTLVQSALKEFEDARFSAHLFGSGTFWEQSDFQEKIDGNSHPYAFLLDYLMEVRKQLLLNRTWQLKASTIDKLLITSILVKFLEDIKDDEGKHTLRKIYKKYNLETETFEQGLRKGICVEILGDLTKEFNGQIFNTFTEEELQKIATTDLTSIANFLSAKIDVKTHQGFLWKQYSFNHLPAEVISAIYENFIQEEAERNKEKKKDIVYTPLHLVNLLVDEAMPLDKPELFKNDSFKVLDPACGSGVFLVAAYKRMLQWWAINNWKKTGKITYPNKKVAKRILEKNIFGVDIEEVAALVSVFGLTTAFLDKLTPKEIWDNLKFKDLSKENIQGVNFANWAKIAKEKEERFDLVIGNPPFNPAKKGTITNDDLEELCEKKVPGNKLALKFFEVALFFGKKVCMIIPSNNFLYNKSSLSNEYRKEIFTNHTVEKIYDFTHLRESLFVKKNKRGSGSKKKTGRTPVLALLVENKPSVHNSIEHIIVKRESLSEQKMHFEIDYYDKHQVNWKWAIDAEKQFVWKTNLLGGGRLFHLVYRFNLLEKLGEFLNENEIENGWVYSNGYITQFGDISDNEQAEFLNNHLRIKARTFDEFGNYETEKISSTEYFHRKRNKKLFSPPHIIFKLTIEKSKIPMAFVKEYLCFNSSFVGISSPIGQEEELFKIYNRLHKNEKTANLYRALILANSSKALVYHETSIVKEDIDNLPYPEDEKYLTPSNEESILINDVLKYYRHLGKAISKNSAGAVLHQPISPEELGDFGTTFCETLNEIYAEDGKSWQKGTIIHTPTFISYQFGFGKDGGLTNTLEKNTELDFQNLLNNYNKGAIHKRIIRQYKHINGYDCVFLIKPKTKRYWLESIALRDADDTFIDLRKAGF